MAASHDSEPTPSSAGITIASIGEVAVESSKLMVQCPLTKMSLLRIACYRTTTVEFMTRRRQSFWRHFTELAHSMPSIILMRHFRHYSHHDRSATIISVSGTK